MKKCQNKLNSFIKNHKNITFSGNKRYIQKSAEYYLKNIKSNKNNINEINQINEYQNKIKNNNIQNKKSQKMNKNKNLSNLTPIPITKKNCKVENKFEKDELNKAKRTAILIRRYEYSANIRKNNFHEIKHNFNLFKIVFIQQWWKYLFRVIRIQKIYKGFFFRKKFIILLENQYYFVEKICLINNIIQAVLLKNILHFVENKKCIQKINKIFKIIEIFNRGTKRYFINYWYKNNKKLSKRNKSISQYFIIWKNKIEKKEITKKLVKYIKENIINISKDLFTTPSKNLNFEDKSLLITTEGKINYCPYSYKNINYIIINNLNDTNPSNVKNGFNSDRNFKNMKYSPFQITKFNFNSNETIYYKEKDLNDMNTILYSISSNSDSYFSSHISKKNSKKDFNLNNQLKYTLNEWNKIFSLKKIITNLIKYQLRNKRNICFNFWKKKIKGKTIINQILNFKKKEILKKYLLIWKDKKKIIELKYIIRLLIFNRKLFIKGKLLLQKIKLIIFKYVKNKIFQFLEIKSISIKPKYKKSKLIKKIMNTSLDKIIEKQKILKHYISKWKIINNKKNNYFLSCLSIIRLLYEKIQKKSPNNEGDIKKREMIVKGLFNKKINISLKYSFMKWEKMIKNINYENLINYNSPRIYIYGESLDASLLENKNISIETIPQINNSISDESNSNNLNLISIINTDKNELLNSNEYTSDNNDIVNLKTPDTYMKKSYLIKNNNFAVNNFNKIIEECEKNIENKNNLLNNIPIHKDDNKNVNEELLIIKPISFLSLIEKNYKEEYDLNKSSSKSTENEIEELIINPNFLTIFYRPFFNLKRIRTNFKKDSNEICEMLNKSEDITKFRNNLFLNEEKALIKRSLSWKEILLEERKNNKRIKNSVSESYIKYRRNKNNINQKLLPDNMDLTFKNGQFYTFGSYEQKDLLSNDTISNKNANINKNINQENSNNINQYQKDNFRLINNVDKNEDKNPELLNSKTNLNLNKSNDYKIINDTKEENNNQKENHPLYSNRNKQNQYSSISNRVNLENEHTKTYNNSFKLYNFIYVKRSANYFYKRKKLIHTESNESLNYSNFNNVNKTSYINQSFQNDIPFNNL